MFVTVVGLAAALLVQRDAGHRGRQRERQVDQGVDDLLAGRIVKGCVAGREEMRRHLPRPLSAVPGLVCHPPLLISGERRSRGRR